MNTALTVVDSDSFEVMQRVAKAMVASGYFQDARDVAQATIKILAGAEMGLPPFASMTNIHIIQGRPALGANLIATLIKNDPRYDFRVLKLDDTECALAFYESGQMVGESRFTAADAKKAGTKNMERFPRNMLFARAISNGARWYTPGIFGGAPVYTPEELGATVDEEGNVIEGEVVTPTPQPEPPQTPPANGNGPKPAPQPAPAPTTTSAADYRAWLETQPGPTVPMSLVAQGAVRLGWYKDADTVYDVMRANPLIKQHGVICKAETRVKVASAVILWDFLETLPTPDWWDELPELDDLDETQAAASGALQ